MTVLSGYILASPSGKPILQSTLEFRSGITRNQLTFEKPFRDVPRWDEFKLVSERCHYPMTRSPNSSHLIFIELYAWSARPECCYLPIDDALQISFLKTCFAKQFIPTCVKLLSKLINSLS